MKTIETQRFTLRAFTLEDWPDVHELAVDWNQAPGPAFDKWPATEAENKGFTGYLAKEDKYFAVTLREANKVIGLLALNGFDANGQLDLGHVILSRYQDNDHDREVLGAMVDHIFGNEAVFSIVTRNAPEHAAQLTPLKALGFKVVNAEEPGELVMTREEWEQGRE